MKKIIFLIIFSISVSIYSQNKISFFGGLNYTPPTSGFFEEIYGEASFGLHFGASYEIPIINKLSFRPKIIYSQQGDRKKTTDQGLYTISRTDTHLDFINMPLNVKYGEKTYILAGPQIGLLINESYNGNYFAETKNNFDFGLNLGIGKTITKQLFVELNVYKGFVTFQEFPAIATWDQETKIQNFYLQLSIGFSIR